MNGHAPQSAAVEVIAYLGLALVLLIAALPDLLEWVAQ